MELPKITRTSATVPGAKGFASEFAAKVLPEEVLWTRNIAAASLVAGAVLLIAGKRRTALAVSAAGAGVMLLERPEAVQELWAGLPGYIRQGQDFLVKAEGVIEKLGEQAAKFREAASRFQA